MAEQRWRGFGFGFGAGFSFNFASGPRFGRFSVDDSTGEVGRRLRPGFRSDSDSSRVGSGVGSCLDRLSSSSECIVTMIGGITIPCLVGDELSGFRESEARFEAEGSVVATPGVGETEREYGLDARRVAED